MTAPSEKCVSDRQLASAKCIMDNDDRLICTELLFALALWQLNMMILITMMMVVFNQEESLPLEVAHWKLNTFTHVCCIMMLVMMLNMMVAMVIT